MKSCHMLMAVLAVSLGLSGVCVTQAQEAPPVVIETVTVGNPGNTGDAQMQGIFGAVDYVYAIGKYEVMAGQYTAFLNAVAAMDTYGLYNPNMDYDADPNLIGYNIKRQDDPGNYTYSVAPDWADRPVNYVSFGNAARFRGISTHTQVGQRESTSVVTRYESDAVFEWAVGDADNSAARWRFSLEPTDAGVTLTFWAQIGPARSGLSRAIEAMPDKEERLVARRLDEHRANMVKTIEGIKTLAEAQAQP